MKGTWTMAIDRKGHLLLLLDVLLVVAAALGANYLRFDDPFPGDFPHLGQWLLIDLILTPIVFFFAGLYRGAWRYASISDLKVIVIAVASRSIILLSVFLFLGYDRGVVGRCSGRRLDSGGSPE